MDDTTIKAYKHLGSQYLVNIQSYITSELHNFAKLLKSGDRVLDVGCAGGRDSKVLADYGLRVTGIDLVEDFLREARRLVPKGDFLKMDLCDIDFDDESFHGIYAAAVLLHAERESVPLVLRDFFRVLKIGGVLFVGVKEGSGSELVSDRLSNGLSRMFTYFSQEEMERYLKDAGFDILSSEICIDEAGRGGFDWIRIFAKKTSQ